jgi:RNA polymerase sigma-70 factor, ECF subfamily
MEQASAARIDRAYAPARADEELVAETLSGRTAAFAELALRYRDRVEGLCHRFFADRELIRDLAQESFIKAFAGLSGYRSERPFSAWLRAIVINACYDELRRRRRHPEDVVPDFDPDAAADWAEIVRHASPEEIVEAAEERREARALAHRLLAMLRPEDRLVLILRDAEEMSVNEIAEITGWSEAKVKIRAFRARQMLRKRAESILAARKPHLP